MKKYLRCFIIIGLLIISVASYADFSALESPEIQAYITSLVNKYDFDRTKLETLFSTVTMSYEVIAKTAAPFEAQPWYIYREKMLTAERINKGIAYWNRNETLLNEAESKYGVPASIIVAIIGVETKYGENKGIYPVFNTLVSLAFNHGRRADFFKSELTEYLLLTRENNLPPLLLKGSYAGAVGLPQFMPSSYRRFAIDCKQKGYADLFENDADAIASIGNYLHKHGWETGIVVAVPTTIQGNCDAIIANKKYKPYLTQTDLAQYGITPLQSISPNKACLVQLQVENGNEYWLGLQNFYAISRYNNSTHYVMAVNLLAQRIQEGKSANKIVTEEKPPVIEKPVLFCNDRQ